MYVYMIYKRSANRIFLLKVNNGFNFAILAFLGKAFLLALFKALSHNRN